MNKVAFVTKKMLLIKYFTDFLFIHTLGSMKMFFSNVKTEETTPEGEILGELDQVSVYLINSDKYILKVHILNREFQAHLICILYEISDMRARHLVLLWRTEPL